MSKNCWAFSHVGKVFFGDCRDTMRRLISDGVNVQTCVTSPPYFGLRDYGNPGQLGIESTQEEYISNMVDVFRLVRELLADDGTLWLNLGDSYGKGKQQLGIPWRVAFALQNDGWIFRQDIIWHKPNPMPESVTDRCTKAHEYIFLFSKSPKYLFDNTAIKEPAACAPSERQKVVIDHRRKALRSNIESRHRSAIAGGQSMQATPDGTRNRRSVWSITTRPYKGAHLAVFPPELIQPCILAGSRIGDIVLDPFIGSGTVAQVAEQHDRQWIGCELNRDYEALQRQRLGLFYGEAA